MAELSKLQIRAKVLSVISQLKLLNDIKESDLNAFCNEFEPIDDKKALFDVFIKEFIKMDDKDCAFSSFLLKNTIPIDIIQNEVFELLGKANYSDDVKYKLVQLLRAVGSKFDYNSLPQYFENPDEILDSDTKKLLEAAVINPESMLDFIDFVSAISGKDRIILVKSLKQDYTGDVLANITYPLLYSDFEDSFLEEVIDILSDSKSSLAIAPFNYLIKTTDNDKIKSACEFGLKKLKLAGASENKADEYFKNILANTQIAEMFTTIPDGSGNQAFLITRLNQKKNFSLVAVVTNDILGIIDSFGFFNISKKELIRIIVKFYKSEGKYRVSAGYVKNKIDEAFNLTIKNKRKFPYEFICWSVLLKDIDSCESELFNEKNDNISKEDMISLLTKEYSYRWFFNLDDNAYISELFNKIYDDNITDILQINNLLKEYISKIFDKESDIIWKNRIKETVYILSANRKEADAVIFNSIPENAELFDTFKQILIQRSIFNGFYNLKTKLKEIVFSVNIFKKNKTEEKKYDIKRIEAIIKVLEKNWIYE